MRYLCLALGFVLGAFCMALVKLATVELKCPYNERYGGASSNMLDRLAYDYYFAGPIEKVDHLAGVNATGLYWAGPTVTNDTIRPYGPQIQRYLAIREDWEGQITNDLPSHSRIYTREEVQRLKEHMATGGRMTASDWNQLIDMAAK